MTRLNFTFQEASPLITYSPGGWVEGSSANDTESADYTGSFRVTFTAGATASFSFTGTAVSLFGATRPNHGNYTVNIDQQPTFMAFGNTTDTFNKSLWHADNLGYTQHTVTLTNVPTPNGDFLDLDFVSIERQIGQDGNTVFNATFDDTSPSVQFTGAWEASTNVASAFNGTQHSTKLANTHAVVTFQGCCVELYGQYANAPYSVAVDNQTPLNMQGLDVDLAPNFQHPQTLLYLADGLSEGNHTVTLTNLESNENRPFFFDYAVISSTHQLNSKAPAGTPIASSAGSSPSSTPVGAIAGGVIGGLFALGLVLLGFLALRRRRRRRAEASFPLDLIDEEPKPYALPTRPEYQDEPYSQDSSRGRVLPPLPAGAAYNVPPSKFRPQAPVASESNYSRRSDFTSEEGLLSPQERSEASGSSSHGRAASTATSTSASRSGTSRSASMSRRGTKSRFSTSQGGGGESSEGPTVQEEDAGVVLDPDDEPVARTLPPAYNPAWHRDSNAL